MAPTAASHSTPPTPFVLVVHENDSLGPVAPPLLPVGLSGVSTGVQPGGQLGVPVDLAA